MKNPRIEWKGRGFKTGLSLIEMIIATFILAVGILSLFGMFPTSALAVSEARNTYSASEICREKLEYWMQQGYATVAADPSTLDSGTVNYTDTSNGKTQTWAFTYQVTHTTIVAQEIEQVETVVNWSQRAGVGTTPSPKSVTLDSWVINGWQTP